MSDEACASVVKTSDDVCSFIWCKTIFWTEWNELAYNGLKASFDNIKVFTEIYVVLPLRQNKLKIFWGLYIAIAYAGNVLHFLPERN
jgi:hypothetical protein